MGLLPEMRHPVLDGLRLTKDEPAEATPGEGFVRLADRVLQADENNGPDPEKALQFLLRAAELGVPSAFARIGSLSARLEEASTAMSKHLCLVHLALSIAALATTGRVPRLVKPEPRDLSLVEGRRVIAPGESPWF